MDIDEPQSMNSRSEVEQLLQQFQSLGTVDHDELVGRFQKLLGTQLNYATARFFLDMNNWFVQKKLGYVFLNFFIYF